jgi:hypothetical protein
LQYDRQICDALIAAQHIENFLKRMLPILVERYLPTCLSQGRLKPAFGYDNPTSILAGQTLSKQDACSKLSAQLATFWQLAYRTGVIPRLTSASATASLTS